MKIAILNDTHAGARNSSDIFIEYQRKFYEECFFPYLKENDITNVIHLGDYYEHRKFVNFKALNANRQMFLSVLKERGITMDIIPGNHDVFHKNTNQLCSLKELLGYYTSNVNIIMEPKVMDYDGCKIGLVPWINNENYAETMQFLKTCKADIIGGHFEIAGFEMYKGIPTSHGMSIEPFNRFEQVWSGHFHTKSTQGNITYFGAQMEFNWSDCNDPKFFHVFDTETRQITAVRNPFTLHEKVVYNDEKMDYNSDFDVDKLLNKFVKIVVSKKTNTFDFDRFVDKVQGLDIHELKIAETFEEFAGESIEDDEIDVEETTTLLDSYVEAVNTDLEVERIKGMMREIYSEASNMEIA